MVGKATRRPRPWRARASRPGDRPPDPAAARPRDRGGLGPKSQPADAARKLGRLRHRLGAGGADDGQYLRPARRASPARAWRDAHALCGNLEAMACCSLTFAAAAKAVCYRDWGSDHHAINILMPALSPTMTEGNLAKWHVRRATSFLQRRDHEIETDKATMEVEAVVKARWAGSWWTRCRGCRNAVMIRPAGGRRGRRCPGCCAGTLRPRRLRPNPRPAPPPQPPSVAAPLRQPRLRQPDLRQPLAKRDRPDSTWRWGLRPPRPGGQGRRRGGPDCGRSCRGTGGRTGPRRAGRCACRTGRAGR